MPFSPKRMTVDEFFALPPNTPKSELIDGVMLEVLLSLDHQRRGLAIMRALLDWVEDHADGPPVEIGCQLRSNDYGILIPNLLVRQEGPAELAVEVRSYAAWLHQPGPQTDTELWVVSAREDEVEVYRRDQALVICPGETLTTPLLPGFGLDVATLFDR